jgi:dTDP-4-dehydrorhamnose reductase
MVGRMLSEVARAQGHEAIPVPKAGWDITDPGAALAHLARHRPDVVVNCAAFTDVDGCETRRELAILVNGEGPGVLARACAVAGVRFLHLSSDYVFDGRAASPYAEEAATAPLSAYGASKLAGEEAVRAAGGRWTLLRTAWVYGPWGRHFVSTILRLARESGRLRVVTDQVGAPTYTADLADAILRLLDMKAAGVVHVTNSGQCNWHAFAVEIVRLAGLDVAVEAVTSEATPRPASRPSYSVLSLARYRALTGHTPRPWPEALADFLARPPDAG